MFLEMTEHSRLYVHALIVYFEHFLHMNVFGLEPTILYGVIHKTNLPLNCCAVGMAE